MTNPMLPLIVADDRAGRAPLRRRLGGRAASCTSSPPALLRARASNVPGSREMLALSAAALYARRVIVDNNRDLPARHRARSASARELRWAWLLEGAARWFSGQTEHARPAIARRLREGAPPRFPPGLRDATLLGGTVIDLLAREEGEPAAAAFATRLAPAGARARRWPRRSAAGRCATPRRRGARTCRASRGPG